MKVLLLRARLVRVARVRRAVGSRDAYLLVDDLDGLLPFVSAGDDSLDSDDLDRALDDGFRSELEHDDLVLLSGCLGDSDESLDDGGVDEGRLGEVDDQSGPAIERAGDAIGEGRGVREIKLPLQADRDDSVRLGVDVNDSVAKPVVESLRGIRSSCRWSDKSASPDVRSCLGVQAGLVPVSEERSHVCDRFLGPPARRC